jgi:thioredoxin-related protein
MKHFICVIALCISLFCKAQILNSGVEFMQGLTWDQVKEKAKEERKLVFVDCYATWCKPCKQMDKFVYNNDTVGAYINKKFISLKVQMDTSKNDDDNVRMLYSLARQFERQYKIESLPTYLFFSSDGNIVHIDIGSKSVREFVQLAAEALDSNKQLYTLYSKALSNKLPLDSLFGVANNLRERKQQGLANEIAKKYMHEYLDKQDESAFLEKKNIGFFWQYSKMITIHDRILKLYYEEPNKVDSIVNLKGWAKSQVDYIISKEMIQPAVDNAIATGSSPNWKKLQKNIKREFNNEFAIANILNSKIKWYEYKKDWSEYLPSMIQKWKIYREEYSKYGWLYLNEIAWKVCVHSNQKKYLKPALEWINIAITKDEKDNSGMLDTKANILYKLGYKEQAINLELQAIKLLQDSNEKEDYIPRIIAWYQMVVDAMKKGEPVNLRD